MLLAIVFAVVGGAIGAGVWSLVASLTGYEVGFVASLVGAMAGAGAALGAREECGFASAAIAVVVALGAVLAGKYAAVSLIVLNSEPIVVEGAISELALDVLESSNQEAETLAVAAIANGARREVGLTEVDLWRAIGESAKARFQPAEWSVAMDEWRSLDQATKDIALRAPFLADPEIRLGYFADKMIRMRVERGESVMWPDDVDPGEAAVETDYLPRVWRDAETWRDSMTAEQRLMVLEEVAKRWESSQGPSDDEIEAVVDEMVDRGDVLADDVNRAFASSFSAFDILWWVLAVAAAGRLGYGGLTGE